MTTPGLGKSLQELGESLKGGDPVDPRQIGTILVHVGQGVAVLEAEVTELRDEVHHLKLSAQRADKRRRNNKPG